MSLHLRTEYWDDLAARAAFKKFQIAIHGLDLSEWESLGYWDYDYTPFSFFDGDRIVSSVCVYSLEAIVDGQRTRLAQFSSVGTLPEWRRQGLCRQLTDCALEWARAAHTAVFLFSDDDAIPFYTACGFDPIDEFVEYTEARRVPPRQGAVKLDPGLPEHRALIDGFAGRRSSVSAKFGVLSPKLLAFHCLYKLRDCVYHVAELDCLVCVEKSAGLVKIYDIVSGDMPAFEQLYPYIACPDDREIEFHFHADKIIVDKPKTRLLRGNNMFVKGAFPMKSPVMPFTCRA